MGRKEEVEVLQKWLANPNIKIIGIQGLGGIGKSSLAAYLYQNSRFAAKYWADVSQKPDFAAFAEKTIPALGGSVTQTGDTTQLINDLLKCLRQQRCLLVIDNLETLLNEAREFPDSAYQQLFSRWLQQGDTSTLLLTTQEQPKLLQAEKNWYPLAGMTPSDGAQLLQKLEIQGTVEELAAFAASVDGHPLTLQLVAGFLRQYCHSQLSGVAELGLQQFDLVFHQAEGVHRDKEDARLEWILEQHLQRLSQEQKNFLVNLSVYRQPFDFRAAGRMLEDPPNPPYQGGLEEIGNPPFEGGLGGISLAIVKALRELYNRSLLLETEVKGYYKFQPLVQEYLQKQGTDLSAAHEIAIDHYKSQVKPQPWETLEDVRAYLEIFYHLCQLQRYGEAFYTIEICDSFLDLRGYNAVRAEAYEQLVQVWELHAEEKSKMAVSLARLGNAYFYLGEYSKVIERCQRALKIKEAGDFRIEVDALSWLANAYSRLGQSQQALIFKEQSLSISRAIGYREWEAACLIDMGNDYIHLGQNQRASRFYLLGLTVAQAIGHRRWEAAALNGMGLYCNSLGQYKLAIQKFQQALDIHLEIRDRPERAVTLCCVGHSYYQLKQYEIAIEYYQQSKEIFRDIGNRSMEAQTLNALGNIYGALDQYQNQLNCYQHSLDIMREIGDLQGEADALEKIRSIQNSQGQSRIKKNEIFFQSFLCRLVEKSKQLMIICAVLGLILLPFIIFSSLYNDRSNKNLNNTPRRIDSLK